MEKSKKLCSTVASMYWKYEKYEKQKQLLLSLVLLSLEKASFWSFFFLTTEKHVSLVSQSLFIYLFFHVEDVRKAQKTYWAL